MIYAIEVLNYESHALVLVDGPANADMPALEREWLLEVPDLEQCDTEYFAMWLVRIKGWTLPSFQRYTLPEFTMDLKDIKEVQAMWGEHPTIEDRKPCLSEHSRGYHSYDHARLEDGARVWRCCFCGFIEPLKVPA